MPVSNETNFGTDNSVSRTRPFEHTGHKLTCNRVIFSCQKKRMLSGIGGGSVWIGITFGGASARMGTVVKGSGAIATRDFASPMTRLLIREIWARRGAIKSGSVRAFETFCQSGTISGTMTGAFRFLVASDGDSSSDSSSGSASETASRSLSLSLSIYRVYK